MRSLVVGVNRPLGAHVARLLETAGHEVRATTRGELDLANRADVEALAGRIDTAVLTARLDVAAPAAIWLAERGIARGVVFSSNNVDLDASDPMYQRLRAGEARMVRDAPGWAILRPTMIYGYAGDGNTATMMGRFARWPIVPVPGNGRALQQPIFFEDLAHIAAGCVSGAWDVSGPVSAGGPEILPHRNWLRRIRSATGKRAPILPLRFGTGRLAVAVLELVGRSHIYSRNQLSRVNLDKHVTRPADIPPALAPRTTLDEGLSRLAGELGFTRRYR